MSSSDDEDDHDYVPPSSPSSLKASDRLRPVDSAADIAASAAQTSTNASKALDDLNAATGVSQRAVSKSAEFLSRLTSRKQPKSAPKRKLREFIVPVLSVDSKRRRADISAAAAAASRAAVNDVVKFAGVAYSVTRTAHPTATTKVTGVDHVLDALDAPKTVSTMEKTSLDWDKFKAVEGIEDELDHATKDGYLEKQDFLERVDRKQFELEKAERDRKRRQQQQQQQPTAS